MRMASERFLGGLLAAFALAAALLAFAPPARALTQAQALAIAAGESDDRSTALAASLARGDAGLDAFLRALRDDAVKVAPERVFVVRDGKATDVATGAETPLPPSAEDVVSSNRLRREIEGAIASLQLLSPDVSARRAALKELRDGAGE